LRVVRTSAKQRVTIDSSTLTAMTDLPAFGEIRQSNFAYAKAAISLDPEKTSFCSVKSAFRERYGPRHGSPE
jgi:hypothetical protein